MVKNGKFSSVSVTVGSDLTVTLLLMSVECFSCCRHGFSKMVFRSRKKLEELRKPQIAPVADQKGASPAAPSEAQGAVGDPGSGAVSVADLGVLTAGRHCCVCSS